MPTLSVIAVFVSKQDWMQYEFADHTRSEPFKVTTGEAFVKIAEDLDRFAWIALQNALRNQDVWVPV